MNCNCNFCESENLKEVFSLRKVPFAQNFVFDAFEEAKKCAIGSINLSQCQDCGAVFNTEFNSELIVYDHQYQAAEQYSKIFQNHLAEVIGLIKEKIPNLDSMVTEIGCGKGDFVRLLKSAGYEKTTGYDASYEGDEPNIVKSLFGPNLGIEKSELLVLRHVLEHIEKPYDFLLLLAKANEYKGKIYIEVPDFSWIYENKAFWDFYHEHVNYFDKNFFLRNFKDAEVVSLFGGQFIGVFLDLENFKLDHRKMNEIKINTNPNIFETSIFNISQSFKDFHNVYIWGASSKGVMICNYLDPDRKKIINLIDINPKKWNKFIPVTAHKVIAPEDLINLPSKKDITVVVVNQNYKKEIQNMLPSDLKVTCIEELL